MLIKFYYVKSYQVHSGETAAVTAIPPTVQVGSVYAVHTDSVTEPFKPISPVPGFVPETTEPLKL